MPDNNAQGQFVYFIVAICRYSLSFCKEEQSEILRSYFYQRLTLNTKSNVCPCGFKRLKQQLYPDTLSVFDKYVQIAKI